MAVPDSRVWTRVCEHTGTRGVSWDNVQSRADPGFHDVSEFSTLNTEVEVRMKTRSHSVPDHRNAGNFPQGCCRPKAVPPGIAAALG